MSRQQLYVKEKYQHRKLLSKHKELKTTLSKSDFDVFYDEFEISCTELLSDHLFCNICFNSNENSLTSYDVESLILRKIYHQLKSQMNV